ncbi:MAG: hypothetical protein RIC55_23345 [Pirellulaceae bacterium]
MRKIVSREYKVVLNHHMFEEPERAVRIFWKEVQAFAAAAGVKTKGRFDKQKARRIVFLDTEDHTIRLNGLVLRRRTDRDGVEFTLKCRSPDRYFAADAQVAAAKGLKCETKFEEDIGAPFSSRFSHSCTVGTKVDSPSTLREAAAIFPALGRLRRDGRRCGPKTRLVAVNALQAYERVIKGPTLDLGDEQAEAALILWASARRGRPLVGEFSFRYGDKKERYDGREAERAMRFFLAIQRLDWCRAEGMSKTQYVYRST